MFARVEIATRKIWRYLRWPLAIIAALYLAGIVYELVTLPKKTEATVAAIHAQKLTMDDVDGKHLPPPPDPKLADATVEGIDVNHNGIRDDVELAIFKKYPNDTKLRAAELQYALAQQTYTTRVINADTWKAVAIQLSRGYQCIGDLSSEGSVSAALKLTEARTAEVEKQTFNTEAREKRRVDSDKYTTSYGDTEEPYCDLSL
jgi:hypothetical protein